MEVFSQNQSEKDTPAKGDKPQLKKKVETSPSHMGSVVVIDKRRQRGLCQKLKMPQDVLQMHSMQGDIEGHCVKLERCSLSYGRYLKTPEMWGSSKER